MTDPIQPGSPAAAPTGLTDVERKKVVELAHQFESMLMTQMLREMRKSMLSDEESAGGLGASTMTDTIDVELGSALSRSSGLGLSDMLIKAFDRRAAAQSPLRESTAPAVAPAAPSPNPPVVSAAPGISAPASFVAPATGSIPAPSADPGNPSAASVGPVLPEGRVSSAYGWRADPFSGLTRFHSGTDVKMAYGQEVRSAAEGRVAFVGEQAGYGLTVRIDHGNGLETRYAHLSQSAVTVGDTVASGQVVARSGNSGRSTGPHLHFEVLEHGRAVAPETMEQLLH
jgi:murein DD-endopeptidase MepM/ murein hydrolase activator NlpD